MNKTFSRMLALAVLALAFPFPSQAEEPLVLCVEKTDVRPWRTREGGGLNFELIDRAARRLGIHFKYEGMPWKQCLAETKANRVAGAIGASFQKERLEIAVYPGGDTPDASKRLHIDRYVMLRRKGGGEDWDGKAFRNLRGPIGIQSGYSVGEQLRALSARVDDGAQDGEELARRLAAGRLAAAAMLEGEATALLNRHPKFRHQLEILPTPLIEKPYFVVFSLEFVKQRGDLAKRFWNALETERNSSEYQKLEQAALANIGH